MDVSKIMVESFDMLLNRDKNLQSLSDKATELKDGSANVSLISSLIKFMSLAP